MLVLKKPFPADILVRISAIVIIAGFLSVLLFETGVSRIPNAIIGSGYIVFEMVSWIVLVSVACKNPLDAIPVIAWGRGIISLGVTVGAQVGNLTNWLSQATNLGVSVVTCVFVLLFCAYDMFVLHFFSFDETIHDLVPLKEVALSPKVLEAQAQDDVSLIDRRCQAIGGSCGLTPKETAGLHDAREGAQQRVYPGKAGREQEHGQDARQAHLPETRHPLAPRAHRLCRELHRQVTARPNTRHREPPVVARRGVKTTMRAPRCTEGRACKPVLSQLDEHMFLRTVPLVPRTQNRVVEPLGRRFDELHSKPELLA